MTSLYYLCRPLIVDTEFDPVRMRMRARIAAASPDAAVEQKIPPVAPVADVCPPWATEIMRRLDRLQAHVDA
ncbi:hypothetical protein ACOSP7_003303 [Xanthoceras sorbifolium]